MFCVDPVGALVYLNTVFNDSEECPCRIGEKNCGMGVSIRRK